MDGRNLFLPVSMHCYVAIVKMSCRFNYSVLLVIVYTELPGFCVFRKKVGNSDAETNSKVGGIINT